MNLLSTSFSHFPLPSEGGFLPFLCSLISNFGSSLKLPRHSLSVLYGVEYQKSWIQSQKKIEMPVKLSLHLQRVFHVFHERGHSRSMAEAGLLQNNGFLLERGQALV
ncbi:hypothetical protein MRB53_020541 [Persea americana]|uniref:Uncharacterized protein n=1 Tax=Persea americana TaxID=3435 RepID=A0ACC2L185_PERAE|nr:hypothetical protein MRB53_020541 [Persea americana]